MFSSNKQINKLGQQVPNVNRVMNINPVAGKHGKSCRCSGTPFYIWYIEQIQWKFLISQGMKRVKSFLYQCTEIMLLLYTQCFFIIYINQSISSHSIQQVYFHIYLCYSNGRSHRSVMTYEFWLLFHDRTNFADQRNVNALASRNAKHTCSCFTSSTFSCVRYRTYRIGPVFSKKNEF